VAIFGCVFKEVLGCLLDKSRKEKRYFVSLSWSDNLIAMSLAICCFCGAYDMVLKNGSKANSPPNKVLLVTSMGDITIELFDDMPITSENFENLTECGIFNGTIFHRVVHNFVVQGGDATLKGIDVPTIRDELPNKHSNVRGSVAMAKTSEPNSANSQFYINLVDNVRLDNNYSVFGKVVAGMNVVDAIANVPVDANDKPLRDVIILRAELIQAATL